MGERLTGSQKVTGSIPVFSTMKEPSFVYQKAVLSMISVPFRNG